jgi:hypothetical protein
MEVSIMEVINTGELVKKPALKENIQGKAKIENVNELRKKLYLNEYETAEFSNRAVSTLRNDRHLRRGFPYLKIGKRSIRYKTEDVIGCMERRRISFEDEQ